MISPLSPATAELPHSGYAYEECAHCKGIGSDARKSCAACGGKGSVPVHQPSMKCPRCKGSGNASEKLIFNLPFCIVCRGTGWALVFNP